MSFLSSLFGSDSQTNTTSESSSADQTTTNNTTNTTSEWSNSQSWNSTESNSTNVTQDRRLVVDHGMGISSDGGAVFSSNSGNSSTSSNESYWTDNSVTMGDFGAINAAKELQLAAIASNSKNSDLVISAGRELSAQGVQMLNANIAYARDISAQTMQQQSNQVSQLKAGFDSAMMQVASIAGKPLNANDPQRLLIIVGVVVVGIVAFSKLRG